MPTAGEDGVQALRLLREGSSRSNRHRRSQATERFHCHFVGIDEMTRIIVEDPVV
jgi:hypothetical protein